MSNIQFNPALTPAAPVSTAVARPVQQVPQQAQAPSSQLQQDIAGVNSPKKGIVPTLKGAGTGLVAGAVTGGVISLVPTLASKSNMAGLYVFAGVAAGAIGGGLAGGMHASAADRKSAAISSAVVGGVLGGAFGLFSGGVKGALMTGVTAAAIGASGAYAGSWLNQ